VLLLRIGALGGYELVVMGALRQITLIIVFAVASCGVRLSMSMMVLVRGIGTRNPRLICANSTFGFHSERHLTRSLIGVVFCHGRC